MQSLFQKETINLIEPQRLSELRGTSTSFVYQQLIGSVPIHTLTLLATTTTRLTLRKQQGLNYNMLNMDLFKEIISSLHGRRCIYIQCERSVVHF